MSEEELLKFIKKYKAPFTVDELITDLTENSYNPQNVGTIFAKLPQGFINYQKCDDGIMRISTIYCTNTYQSLNISEDTFLYIMLTSLRLMGINTLETAYLKKYCDDAPTSYLAIMMSAVYKDNFKNFYLTLERNMFYKIYTIKTGYVLDIHDTSVIYGNTIKEYSNYLIDVTDALRGYLGYIAKLKNDFELTK